MGPIQGKLEDFGIPAIAFGVVAYGTGPAVASHVRRQLERQDGGVLQSQQRLDQTTEAIKQKTLELINMICLSDAAVQVEAIYSPGSSFRLVIHPIQLIIEQEDIPK